MARGDTLDLQVLGGVAGQLEDLNGRKILRFGGVFKSRNWEIRKYFLPYCERTGKRRETVGRQLRHGQPEFQENRFKISRNV